MARWVNPVQLCFGAIFQREMRVSGRQRAVYWQRASLLLLLLLIVGMAYATAAIGRSTEIGISASSGVGQAAAQLQSLQTIAPSLIGTGLWVVYLCAVLMGAITGAPAIAHERRTRTLDAVVGTTLSGAEVVFGHIAARATQIVLIVLLAIPVLLAVRVFGGVEGGLVAAAGAVILSTVILAVTLGVWKSLSTARTTSAANSTMGLLAILAFLPLIWNVLAITRGWPPPPGWFWWLAHPFALGELTSRLYGGVGLAGLGFTISPNFWIGSILTNLAMSVAIAMLAAWRFRPAALSERLVAKAARAAEKRANRRARRAPARPAKAKPASLPPAAATDDAPAPEASASPAPAQDRATRTVGDYPVFWRELRQPGSASFMVKFVTGVAFIVSAYGLHRYDLLAEPETFISISFIALVVIIATAAGGGGASIAGEREARTWGVLLTTRLSRTEILFSKTLGVVRRQGFILVIIAATWLVACLAGAARPITVLHAAMIFAPVVLFLASTGVVLSLIMRKSTAAAAVNLLLAIALWAGAPILLVSIFGLVERYTTGSVDDFFARLLLATNPFYALGVAVEPVGAVGRARYSIPGDGRVGAGAFTAILAGVGTAWTLFAAGVLAIGVRIFNRYAYREF
ncbi:MAG: hypothetical protein EA378_03575 [Phycisphaerales bacterium]|nr:MAG: hypothetical protein EA378_03575 [Phycisphaerales bacterium]